MLEAAVRLNQSLTEITGSLERLRLLKRIKHINYQL